MLQQNSDQVASRVMIIIIIKVFEICFEQLVSGMKINCCADISLNYYIMSSLLETEYMLCYICFDIRYKILCACIGACWED